MTTDRIRSAAPGVWARRPDGLLVPAQAEVPRQPAAVTGTRLTKAPSGLYIIKEG